MYKFLGGEEDKYSVRSKVIFVIQGPMQDSPTLHFVVMAPQVPLSCDGVSDAPEWEDPAARRSPGRGLCRCPSGGI